MKNYILATLAASLLYSPLILAKEIYFEGNSSLPIVHLNAVFKNGSITDPKGKFGITNFTAEMLIRGTHRRTKEQIALALDQMGGKIEIETRAEAVIFRGAVLASSLNSFLGLFEEILTEPVFSENEIRKLKSEIVSAILEEKGQDASLNSRRFARHLFGDHPYGKPILGRTQDIQSINESQIRAHYDRTIRDESMVVIGSGDSNLEVITAWASRISNARHVSAPLADTDISQPETVQHRRLLIVDKPDRTQTQILIGQVGLQMDDPKFFPLHIANFAFGGTPFSSRLKVEIRVKRGWSYGAGSAFRFGKKPRLWTANLFPASKYAPDALAYTLKMIEELKRDGITKEELEFSKQSLIKGAGFMYNTPAKRVENAIIEKTLGLPDGLMKSYADRMESVTWEETNQAIKEYIRPNELTISVLATAKVLKEALSKASGEGTEVIVSPYTED
ncbi:MAG: pitrilysin family protein [Bdellovibrionota bacterium]